MYNSSKGESIEAGEEHLVCESMTFVSTGDFLMHSACDCCIDICISNITSIIRNSRAGALFSASNDFPDFVNNKGGFGLHSPEMVIVRGELSERDDFRIFGGFV